MNSINKILVANRGEIALRIMKTARRMGIKTVAIFSDADRDAPHVTFADEAWNVGPPPSSQSYLDGKRIIEIAKTAGADAIHPGYGFLSENAGFAEAVEKAGITFIGPTAHSIEIMGSKLAAKEAAKAYNIPMVPGTDKPISENGNIKEIAAEIGYPILIKASAGGGGKGMRLVEKESELSEQIARAISEAKSSFGDGSVFIEKFVTQPRHIEIQVLADQHGNVVHLFERECSIQRRHQKVVEEAPSSLLTPDIRQAMGTAAINAAKSCDYRGAGTVEFLVDADLNFYFLEMNTRLQVEHPVTEMITGIDLVEQQIRVARGEKLAFGQEDLSIRGHAIELRVYAEDPLNNFLPSIGKLNKYSRPSGEGIRVDDGYEENMDIPIFYDPMIAKLIAYGPDREEAIQKLKEAINRYEIEGVATTLLFGKFVMEHEAFISGKFDTGFVEKYFSADKLKEKYKDESEVAAELALYSYLQMKEKLKVPEQNVGSNWWKRKE